MPGLYDEVLAQSGWQPVGTYAISNPDSLQYVDPNNPTSRGRTYSSNPDAPDYHPNAELINLMLQGQTPTTGWMERYSGEGISNGDSEGILIGPDGRPVAGSYTRHGNNDSGFWNGALLAGLVTGANIYGASGAGAGSVADTGVAAPGSAAPIGAQTFPVASSGYGNMSYTEQLAGLSGGAGAPMTTAGTAPASAGAYSAGSSPAGFSGGNLAEYGTSGSGGGSGLGSLGTRDYVNIVSGLYGMSLANQARDASDPFREYRGAYGEQLAALEANPSAITRTPGWLSGIELVNRQMASKGFLGSGNQAGALSRYAGDFLQNEKARLATLAGANATPGAGSFSSAELAGRSLASIGYGLAPLFSGRG